VRSLVRYIGKGTDAGGLKKEGWTALIKAFNEKTGVAYDKTQCQGKIGALKREYTRVHKLRTDSAFGWDGTKGVPTAPDDVWAAYIATHPQCAIYRFVTL